MVIHNEQNRSIIIGWSADAKFEVVRQINGNEVVAIQLRGEYHYHYHHIEWTMHRLLHGYMITNITVWNMNEDKFLIFFFKGYVIDAILGILSDHDLTNEYGTAASIDYQPYIINPLTSRWSSTREIRNR